MISTDMDFMVGTLWLCSELPAKDRARVRRWLHKFNGYTSDEQTAIGNLYDRVFRPLRHVQVSRTPFEVPEEVF